MERWTRDSSAKRPRNTVHTRSVGSVSWDFGAIADVPAIAFAEDLIEAYPEAKVVLVERDLVEWYRSFNNIVIEHAWRPVMRLFAYLRPWFVGPIGSTHRRWIVGWIKAGSREQMRKLARPTFREHYELVRKVTPHERFCIPSSAKVLIQQ